LVGSRAHSELWPKILRWVGAHWSEEATAAKPVRPTAGNAEDAEENREDAEKDRISSASSFLSSASSAFPL